MMKLLIISNTTWDDNNSFGNSFSNIFGGNNYQIANICCQTGNINTNVCSRFFQISTGSILQSLLKKNKSSGSEVYMSQSEFSGETKYTKKAKVLRWQIFFWMRDLVWASGYWKTKELDQFILDFNPDLIILPIYYSTYINELGLYVQRLTGKPVVGYISDDCYTLKQFSLSPLFWVDRLIKRVYVKRAIDKCEILYTITESQKKEYNGIFGNKCQVLYKGGQFTDTWLESVKTSVPLKLIYTGNLGCGRWKTLELIGKAIDKIGIEAVLDIYSGTTLSEKILQRLRSVKSIMFHGRKDVDEIKSIQRDADILVHVESFEITERYSARLSFSTKIVDYFEAGKCILAVGWDKSGAIEYLKEHNAAFIISEQNLITEKLKLLFNDPQNIRKYAYNAYLVGRENHRLEDIQTTLYSTLNSIHDNFKLIDYEKNSSDI